MQKIFLKGALVLGAAGAVLAGCNGDDDGGPNPQPTGTATGTASGTASATASGTASPTATALNAPNVTVAALVNASSSSSGQRLYVFNAQRPTVALRNPAISGLPAGARLVGIDFRPANRVLYGLGSNRVLYFLNTSTGAATAVGSGFSQVSLSGTNVGFDFNPVPDRIRVVTDARQNFRLNPNTGAAVDGNANTAGFQSDGTLTFNTSDANSGVAPRLTAAAYTNSVAGATSTTNFAIDAATNSLVRQGTAAGFTPVISPNSGILFTIGALGVSGLTSFDIGPTGVALAASSNALYSINLSSGAASRVANFGTNVTSGGGTVSGLSIVP